MNTEKCCIVLEKIFGQHKSKCMKRYQRVLSGNKTMVSSPCSNFLYEVSLYLKIRVSELKKLFGNDREYLYIKFINVFFFYLGFLSRTFTIHGTAGEGEGIYLTPLYHFHPLHRHLDISRTITAESSPLHIASSRTRAGNLWFPSASR